MGKWMGKGKAAVKRRVDIYNRDNFICCYCGIVTVPYAVTGVSNPDTTSLDHIVPQKELAQSATDDADFVRKQRDPKNLVVACVGCNSSKQHTPLYVWASQTGKDYPAILIEIGKRIQKEI